MHFPFTPLCLGPTSLMLPALLSGECLLRGYVIGAVGYASRLFDLPSGAAIVLSVVGPAGAMSLFNRDANA